jgi:hypothetical protein
MLPNHVAMAGSWGLKNTVNLYYHLLKGMIHNIQIEEGNENTYFQDNEGSPVYGTDHGSGNIPGPLYEAS